MQIFVERKKHINKNNYNNNSVRNKYKCIRQKRNISDDMRSNIVPQQGVEFEWLCFHLLIFVWRKTRKKKTIVFAYYTSYTHVKLSGSRGRGFKSISRYRLEYNIQIYGRSINNIHFPVPPHGALYRQYVYTRAYLSKLGCAKAYYDIQYYVVMELTRMKKKIRKI